MFNQKGLVPIAIILIIAVVIGGYFLYQKQKVSTPLSQPTTQQASSSAEMINWKTYIDKTLNYSFQYPSNWTIKVSEVNYLTDDKGNKFPAYTVDLNDESNKTQPFTLWSNFQGGFCEGVQNLQPSKLTTQSGLEGILQSCGDNRYYSFRLGSNNLLIMTKDNSLYTKIIQTLSYK